MNFEHSDIGLTVEDIPSNNVDCPIGEWKILNIFIHEQKLLVKLVSKFRESSIPLGYSRWAPSKEFRISDSVRINAEVEKLMKNIYGEKEETKVEYSF
jgi:hypothetical protein